MTARTIRTTINQTELQVPVDGGEIANAVILGDFIDDPTGEPYRLWTLPEDDQ
ncbi:hypothetical protein [Brevundimonas diminuta]|uniref:Uncharacterized protein n=1 Tax=Brevundimonas diminuta TaxID=293 RepID=A0A2X1AQG6_BREDI|nr:hypothetical protein [Brevundimonas diminuta]SPU46993.1 Uncharacterised protein [Brevundimonas diminuta]